MATIKISDLSVGDWVQYRDREWQVCSLYQFTGEVGLWRKDSQICENVADCKPIPITAEILEKNGFVKKNYDNGKMLDWCCDNILVRKFADEDFYRFIVAFNSEHYTTMMVVVKHTHQLQQALRLAGVDKKINL